VSYWKLMSSFDSFEAVQALEKTITWNESEPGYYSLSFSEWPAEVKDLADVATKFLANIGESRVQVSKADYDFPGVVHADYDQYNVYDPEIGHNRFIKDYVSRIDNPWGTLRFVLFLNKSKMRVEINKDIIHPKSGDLFWIEHYAPHWFINESEDSRYQIVLDIDTHQKLSINPSLHI